MSEQFFNGGGVVASKHWRDGAHRVQVKVGQCFTELYYQEAERFGVALLNATADHADDRHTCPACKGPRNVRMFPIGLRCDECSQTFWAPADRCDSLESLHAAAVDAGWFVDSLDSGIPVASCPGHKESRMYPHP